MNPAFGQPILTYLTSHGEKYAHELQKFLQAHDLMVYSSCPVDHIAVKARDAAQYEEIVAEILPLSKNLTVVDLDKRRIAVAQLDEPLPFGAFGVVDMIEIAEPRPEKVGKDFVGFEHCEMLFAHPQEIQALAEKEGLSYEHEQKEVHEAIVFKLNESGQEVKFKNTPMSDIRVLEEKRGALQWIKR